MSAARNGAWEEPVADKLSGFTRVCLPLVGDIEHHKSSRGPSQTVAIKCEFAIQMSPNELLGQAFWKACALRHGPRLLAIKKVYRFVGVSAARAILVWVLNAGVIQIDQRKQEIAKALRQWVGFWHVVAPKLLSHARACGLDSGKKGDVMVMAIPKIYVRHDCGQFIFAAPGHEMRAAVTHVARE